MTEAKLEPAVGRLLVTPEGDVWEITAIHPDGALALKDPMGTNHKVADPPFRPAAGEWIAPDLLTVKTWARLTGVKLR